MSADRELNFTDLSTQEARLFDNIIDEIKAEYHDLVDSIRQKTDHSIFWQVNNLLSRNNYVSDLFYNLCCLAMVQNVEQTRPLDKVIVKSDALKIILVQYFSAQKKDITVESSATLSIRIKRILKPFYDIVRNLHWAMVYLWCKQGRRQRKIPRDVPITLLDTFFSTYIFKSGKFKERYYTGLDQVLSPRERRLIYFVPNVITWRKLSHIIQLSEEADENFLYPFDFLKIQDYLFALSAPLQIRRINLNRFEFRGVNIAPILKSDFRHRIALRTSFRGILFYRFFKRLKEENIKLKLVVDWFENQVVDRGFNRGKNKFFPQTPSIGYQGLIGAYKWNFHLQPTKAEADAGVLPHKIAVIGSGLTGIVKENHPDLKVFVASGFRFTDIHEKKIKPLGQFHTDRPTILVALPIWVEDSLDILRMMVAVKDQIVGYNPKVLIKPHPSLDFDRVLEMLGSWPEVFSIAGGNFPDLIEYTDLLISSGSTVCMESIAYGVPVIVVGSRLNVTKNIIPLRIPRTIWALCFEEKELLAETVRLCFHPGKEDRALFSKIAAQVRSEFFKPVYRKDIETLFRL